LLEGGINRGIERDIEGGERKKEDEIKEGEWRRVGADAGMRIVFVR
jgi:hypothetical protein